MRNMLDNDILPLTAFFPSGSSLPVKLSCVLHFQDGDQFISPLWWLTSRCLKELLQVRFTQEGESTGGSESRSSWGGKGQNEQKQRASETEGNEKIRNKNNRVAIAKTAEDVINVKGTLCSFLWIKHLVQWILLKCPFQKTKQRFVDTKVRSVSTDPTFILDWARKQDGLKS